MLKTDMVTCLVLHISIMAKLKYVVNASGLYLFKVIDC